MSGLAHATQFKDGGAALPLVWVMLKDGAPTSDVVILKL